MRRMRFISLLAIATSLITMLVAMAGPPATPEARDRNRLRVAGKLEGTLRTHSEAVQAADGDSSALSRTMHAEEMKYIRYLDMHNIPPSARPTYYGIISVLLNSCIKERETMVLPAYGGPDNMLIRINLHDYGIDTKAWDILGAEDPYYHQFVRQQDVLTQETPELEWYKTGLFYGGDTNKPEWKQRPKAVTSVTTPIKKKVLAGHLDFKAIGNLCVTLHTTFPILRADWFIVNMPMEPHYSNFLGIKTLSELKKFGGFDDRADSTEVLASVVTSGSDGLCPSVAVNNRFLARRRTLWGGWWETYDFSSSTGSKNVINNFISFLRDKSVKNWKPKRDAAEYIVRAPTGLQWYMITDAEDKAIATGDINIVVDSLAIDAQVRNGRSCIWCHSNGINPFKSSFQNQVGPRMDQSDLGFYDKDPKKAIIIRQRVQDVFGTPNFDYLVKLDQAQYDCAVRKASGMGAADFAFAFRQAWDGYVNDRVDIVKACYELGVTEEELRMILGLRFEGRSNGVLIQALLVPPVAIRRDQWEESFAEAALLSTLKGQFKAVPVALPKK